MKKIILTVMCLTLALAAGAQDIKDRASKQLNIDQNLWYNTANAAGLARDAMASWRDVSLNYGFETGKFTDSWNARRQSAFSLSGDTFMDIEGFRVAADANLEFSSLKNCKYNNSLYQVDWDMPYFVALNAEEPFRWGRTRADLNVSASTPLMFDDMFSFGVNLGIGTRIASKNAAPGARYSDLTFKLSPSATLAIDDDNIVGLAIYYETTPARSTVGKGEALTSVAFLQGLGEYTTRWAGGDMGIDAIKYNSFLIGAGVQYNHMGDAVDLMAEFSLHKGVTSATEGKTLQGTVDRYLMGAHMQGLFGDDRNRKLTLDFDYNLNYWIKPLGSSTIAHNNLIDVDLDYTIYLGATRGGAFDWMLGGGIDFDLLSLKRVVPEGKLTATNLLPHVSLGKNIRLAKEESLLVKADLGYNFSMNADYEYNGKNTEGNYFVHYMYDDEADYLGRYFLRTKLDATYTYQVNTFFSAYASMGGALFKPMGVKGSRLAMLFSLGVMF